MSFFEPCGQAAPGPWDAGAQADESANHHVGSLQPWDAISSSVGAQGLSPDSFPEY